MRARAEGPVRFLGLARWLRIAALAVAGLAGAFWLVFVVGEVAGGDLSGLSHLAPVVAMGLLMALSFRRPAMGAVAMLAVGVAWSLYVTELLGAALLGGPFLLAGALLGAAWLIHRRRRDPAKEAET